MLQVRRNIKLFAAADETSEQVGPLITGGYDIEKIADAADNLTWWQVTASKGTEKHSGFLPQSLIIVRPELTPPDNPEINIEAFMTQLTIAARVFGVNRDYLAAVAVAETGMANIKTGVTGGSAFGPFQFTKNTWAGMVDQFGAKYGIDNDDRFKPARQAIFAALATKIATEKLQEVLKVGGIEDTRLPTATELYFAHFLGWPAARKLLVLDRTVPVRQALIDAGQDADDVIAMNKSLLGDGSISVAAALEALGGRLTEALNKVGELTAQLPEFLRFAPTSTDEPPWLTRARQFKDVKEKPGKTESEPQIEDFHASTSSGRMTDDVPWCASFVNFCMMTSGNDKVARSVEKVGRSARAANWLEWGETTLTEPLPGALVVLHPQVPESSGHVGFWVAAGPTKVTLFGGNQSNAVREQDYDLTAIRAMRWMNWA